jgi:hypothetical protein
MTVKVKAKSVPAKMTAVDAEQETDGASSALASTTSTSPSIGRIIGESVSEDYGSPTRLSLVSDTSALAKSKEVEAGQWALSNGLGAAVDLGTRIEIIPLVENRWWLMDFGQGDSGGPPVRFRTEAEVHAYGGCLAKTPEPGKPTFSRSMEIHLVITSATKVPGTFMKFSVCGREYPVALYEAARTAYRTVGVGLNLHAANTGEKPWDRKWALGVTTRLNRSVNSTYFIPVLEDRGPTSAAERAELARIVERQLPA